MLGCIPEAGQSLTWQTRRFCSQGTGANCCLLSPVVSLAMTPVRVSTVRDRLMHIPQKETHPTNIHPSIHPFTYPDASPPVAAAAIHPRAHAPSALSAVSSHGACCFPRTVVIVRTCVTPRFIVTVRVDTLLRRLYHF